MSIRTQSIAQSVGRETIPRTVTRQGEGAGTAAGPPAPTARSAPDGRIGADEEALVEVASDALRATACDLPSCSLPAGSGGSAPSALPALAQDRAPVAMASRGRAPRSATGCGSSSSVSASPTTPSAPPAPSRARSLSTPQGRLLPGDSRFTVDLRTLRSDEARRDNYVRRNTLETERFPTVTFVPTEARRLPFPLPQTGSVPFELVGDLTVKDVTRRVTWEATASFEGPRSPSARGPRSASAISASACPGSPWCSAWRTTSSSRPTCPAPELVSAPPRRTGVARRAQ